jgi:hypothetical protein
MKYDVQMRPPQAGVRSSEWVWVTLASGVTEFNMTSIVETAIWETRCVPCVEEARIGTGRFVPPVRTDLTKGTEFDVWMRYAPHGGKVPWGVIASRVTATQATAYLDRMLCMICVTPLRVDDDACAL